MNKLIKDLGKYITDPQIKGIAETVGLTFAHLKAFIVVETNGKGFYEGTLIPVIRFENHIFARETNNKYNVSHPHLSSVKFTNKYNKAGIAEIRRFEEAYTLDGQAAVMATSWGLPQIMGFNWKVCGYKNLTKFLNDVFDSEYTQVKMLGNFLKNYNKSLYSALLEEKWEVVAEIYNGKDYARNNYHVKLKEAFAEYK